MLEKQLQFFKENEKRFAREYSGKYIVIPEDLSVHEFESLEQAYLFGVEQFGLGNFLLQDCNPNFVGKVQIISPTVVFA